MRIRLRTHTYTQSPSVHIFSINGEKLRQCCDLRFSVTAAAEGAIAEAVAAHDIELCARDLLGCTDQPSVYGSTFAIATDISFFIIVCFFSFSHFAFMRMLCFEWICLWIHSKIKSNQIQSHFVFANAQDLSLMYSYRPTHALIRKHRTQIKSSKTTKKRESYTDWMQIRIVIG